MTRTFHARMNKKTLFACLLPAAVAGTWFFWEKMPLPALCCLSLAACAMERLLHTCYVFTPDGFLIVRRGRLSKARRYPLSDIDEAERARPSALAFFGSRDAVMLTFGDGSVKFVTPFPAEEFCRYFRRRKEAFVRERGGGDSSAAAQK